MEYTLNIDIPISKKIEFINEVSSMVVSQELGYITILEDIMYKYCLVKYFTDIEIFKVGFNVDELEAFIKDNKSTIDDIQIAADNDGMLLTACREAIRFKRENFINTIDEFIITLTNVLNDFGNKTIDTEVVQALAKIVPIVKNMDSSEVAKAIIESKTEVS